VVFKKLGEIRFQAGGQSIAADRVQLQITFLNAQGKQVYYRTYDPELCSSERVRHSAAIELNEIVYGRAVDGIKKLSFPAPSELK